MTLRVRHWRQWLSPAARRGRQAHRERVERLAQLEARQTAPATVPAKRR